MEYCPECPDKVFKNKKLLKQHLGKDHSYLAVICPYCTDKEHTFKRVFDLKVHCEKKHVESKELPKDSLTEANAFYLSAHPKKYAECCVKADRLSPIAVNLRTLMLQWVANCKAPNRTRAEILEGWDADDDLRMPVEIQMVDPPVNETTMEVLHVSLNLRQVPHADLKDGHDKIRVFFTPDLYDDKLAMRALARIMARTQTTMGHLRFDTAKADTNQNLRSRVSAALRIHSSLISTIKVLRVVFDECSSPKRARIAPLIEPDLPEAAVTTTSPQTDILGAILSAQAVTHAQDKIGSDVIDTSPNDISADQIMLKAAEISGVLEHPSEVVEDVTLKYSKIPSDTHSLKSTRSISTEMVEGSNIQEVYINREPIDETIENTAIHVPAVYTPSPRSDEPPSQSLPSVPLVQPVELIDDSGSSTPVQDEKDYSGSAPVTKPKTSQINFLSQLLTKTGSPSIDSMNVERPEIDDRKSFCASSSNIVDSLLNDIVNDVVDKASIKVCHSEKLTKPVKTIDKIDTKKRVVSIPRHISVISTMNSSELSVPAPKNKTLAYRATKLLRMGAMPLFPPARRDWKQDEMVTLREGTLELKWPPKQWQQMSPDQRLLQQEFTCMQIIKERLGSVLKVDRTELLETFNFLALPGSKSFKLSSTEQLSRYHTFTTLVAITKGRRLDQWLAMMEGVTICRDTSNDSLIKACSKIPLRL